MDPVGCAPRKGQIDDLLDEIEAVIMRNERVDYHLTKKMAKTSPYLDAGIMRYLHSDIETLERIAILRDLRLGTFDVLVGINLLREGLDLPEVSLVAILDADQEGFLRSETSLIQTIGRAARNASGRVVMYADHITDSMHEPLTKPIAGAGYSSSTTKRWGLPRDHPQGDRYRSRAGEPGCRGQVHAGKGSASLVEDVVDTLGS